MKLRIGTRKSKLAMVQTEMVRDAILACFPDAEIELVPISTKGDRHLDRSLTSFGGKGVFTRELEEALLQGKIDMAVHSAKDMPMEFPAGLALGAVLDREDPRDVLVTANGTAAKELPAGSVIGTSSLRRELQIKRLNPQVKIRLLRGNVQTRIDKLREGGYDGILLAAAGLKRLGLTEQEGIFLEYLDAREFIPASGQGILGVEIREGELAEVMAAVHSAEAEAVLNAERKYLTVLGGSCNAPCAAYCRQEGKKLRMSVMYARDGQTPVFREESMELEEGQQQEKRELAEKMAVGLARRVRLQPVSLVGAGPGDAGLFTLKGLACVQRADVIIYDNLISGSILNEARLDAELIYAGKRSNHHHLTQNEIQQLLVQQALSGKYVVRLKGGDPFVFGRGGEEALVLQEQGIPFEIVPGVSSSYSVPAYAGIPVTQRELASSFHVITGHEGAHKSEEVLDYATLAKEGGTLVFLMGLKNLDRIAGELLAHGKPKDTPAAVIQNGTTSRQKKVVSTLEHIARDVKLAEIGTPAITVVGSVAGLGERLDWFGGKPLSGKRVLATGSRYIAGELEKVLALYGAETVSVSLIESRLLWNKELEQVLAEAGNYQWIVFTSSNGVELFFTLLRRQEIDLRRFMHVKFAAIGRKTAQMLKNYGFFCDFVPSGFSGADLAREWIPTLGEGERVLLLRAKDGSPVLTQKLSEAGIPFADVPLYETWVDERRKEELNRLIKEVDYVTIASGSAVRALEKIWERENDMERAESRDGMEGREDWAGQGTGEGREIQAGQENGKREEAEKKRKTRVEMNPRIISIGPSTTKAAEQAGIPVWKTASEYTAEGIGAAILSDVYMGGDLSHGDIL